MKHILIVTVLIALAPSFAFSQTRLKTFSVSRFSQEQIFTRPKSNTNERLSVRFEDGQWTVESFLIAQDGFQEPNWREVYPNFHDVQTRLRDLNARLEPLALEGPFRELKSSALASQSLWTVTQAWSKAWEQKYAEWVLQNADQDFFVRHNLATDCADVAYSLRWIFARMNGLPAAAQLSGSKTLLTQNSMRTEWARLPTDPDWSKDRRFRKALDYLLTNTYTHTLLRDSFPVRITPDALLAGSHYLSIHGKSGHTQYVYRTYYNDAGKLPIKMLNSTVPRSVRSLYVGDFWQGEQPKEADGGFLRFRWAQAAGRDTTVVEKTRMPDYSLEQYDPNFMNGEKNFGFRVMKTLNPSFTFETVMKNGVAEIRTLISNRKSVVEEGYAACQKISCGPGTPGYEDWSTPSRDARLRELIQTLANLAGFVPSEISSTVAALWDEAQKQIVLDLGGHEATLAQVQFVLNYGLASTDPTVSIARRWALQGDAFGENFVEKIETNLKTREQAVQQMKSSAKEDAELRAHIGTLEMYCAYFAENECGSATEWTKKGLSVNSITRSAKEWLLESIWFMSAPSASRAARWGANQTKFASRLSHAQRRFEVAKNGALLEQQANGEMQLLTPKTQSPVQPPRDSQWVALSPSGNLAAAHSTAGVLSLVSLDEKTTEPLSVEVVGSETFTQARFASDSTFSTTDTAGLLRFHWREGKVFQNVAVPEVWAVSVVAETNSAFLLKTCSMPCQLKIVKKHEASLSQFSIAVGTIAAWLPNAHQLALTMAQFGPANSSSQALLLEVSDDFQILTRSALGTSWAPGEPDRVCALFGKENSVCYPIQNGKLLTTPRKMPFAIGDVRGRYFTTFSTGSFGPLDQKFQLRSRDSEARVLAEANYISFVSSSQKWVLAMNYGEAAPKADYLHVDRLDEGSLLDWNFGGWSGMGGSFGVEPSEQRGFSSNVSNTTRVWIDD